MNGTSVSLTDDQESAISYAYRVFDPDRRGSIDSRELAVLLRSMGLSLPEDALLRAIAARGATADCVPAADARAIAADLMRRRDPRDEARFAFSLLDADGCGKIGLDELRCAARELGEDWSDADLIAMIAEYDRDGDGRISLDEFTAIMLAE